MGADDHWAICETVYRYAYGIDTKDWDLYRSIFTDDVWIDFTSYRPGRPASTMAADTWVGAVRSQMVRLAATHHAMTNPLVTVDGDRATCQMYIDADHALEVGNDEAWFSLGVHYTDTPVHTAPPMDGGSTASPSPCAGVGATNRSCLADLTGRRRARRSMCRSGATNDGAMEADLGKCAGSPASVALDLHMAPARRQSGAIARWNVPRSK